MNLEALRNRLLLLAGSRLDAIPGAADELAREVRAGGLQWLIRLSQVQSERGVAVAISGVPAADDDLLALIDEWAARYRDVGVHPLAVAANDRQKGALRHELGTTRADVLTAVINRAINDAGPNRDTPAAVYTALREIALAGEPPFTGEVDADGLVYTDHANAMQRFTVKALGKRLRRRKSPTRAR